jgi:hypothetical protein
MAIESFAQLRGTRNPLNLKEYWGTAAPSLATDIGPYNVGDIVWNSAPAAGAALGWVCTTAGATGATAVFTAFGQAGLDGVTATAAELNLVDGSSAGVAVANKAAVLGANKNLDEIHTAALYLGAAAGTQVTATAAAINALVAGAAGGYKIARGVTAIGAASEDIATGLTTVVAAVVSLVGDPSMTHMYSSVTPGDQAGAPAAGSIRVKSWKPTAANDCTPIAATDVFANVAWIAIGT